MREKRQTLTLNFNVIVLLLQRLDVVLVVRVLGAHYLYVVRGRLEDLCPRSLWFWQRKAALMSKRERDEMEKQALANGVYFFAFDVGYGVAKRVKTVLDVIAPLSLEGVVVRAFPVGLLETQREREREKER